MTQPKLFFDECIGKPHVDQLKLFIEGDEEDEIPEIQHILEVQKPGIWDEEWVPRLANEDWIIITQDLGKKGKSKGSPLPKLCLESSITHVLLSPRVGKRKSFEKIITILSVWREILALAEEPKGSRFMLEPGSSVNPDGTTGKLVNKTPDPRPAPKGRLFNPDDE